MSLSRDTHVFEHVIAFVIVTAGIQECDVLHTCHCHVIHMFLSMSLPSVTAGSGIQLGCDALQSTVGQ